MTEAQSSIGGLIDELLARTEDPHQQAKREASYPHVRCALEEEGWIQLFHYDINEYCNDAAFCCQQQLLQSLYHLNNFDDDTFFTPHVAVPARWLAYSLWDSMCTIRRMAFH
jgi:hypothetical protein